MDENRKYALFFAATILAARKLQALAVAGEVLRGRSSRRSNSTLDLVVVQVHADFVAYLKFALWVLGWHAKECTIIGIRPEE